ncbi:hypothetical protein POTOM_056749 [Populus tomentosa]|uniref:Uncharacterized protein n=1 Tax=Populus tomentosa TaxID=118781 RepID=A0A8X7XRH2_POPTO|nr:hypothetical protein POTOM_056749 [Populus tomentosa]
MAIEKTRTANLGFQMANVSNTSATDLENLWVSQNGPNLVRALSNTSFIGERVVSNLARLVVITNVNELIKKGEYVGYQENSFVPGILKHIGFDESKLLVYNSPEERDELFSKGGFGFVFPKGSPLVADVLGSVVNVKEIEDAWFGTHSSCPDSSTSVSTNSLNLKSILGDPLLGDHSDDPNSNAQPLDKEEVQNID